MLISLGKLGKTQNHFVMERWRRFELPTFSLVRRHSTTELPPHHISIPRPEPLKLYHPTWVSSIFAQDRSDSYSSSCWFWLIESICTRLRKLLPRFPTSCHL